MKAVNAFEYTEVFEVEVFEDDSFSNPIQFDSSPSEVVLQSMDSREFVIQMDEVSLEDFIVCTRTNRDNGSSRVCSRVLVCQPYASNTECKRQLSKRRGEYLIGR